MHVLVGGLTSSNNNSILLANTTNRHSQKVPMIFVLSMAIDIFQQNRANQKLLIHKTLPIGMFRSENVSEMTTTSHQ